MDFETLYRLYFLKVYSYVMTLTGNEADAEEITQNAFFRAMRSEKTYRSEASEFTWLCAIARNLFIDECRRRKRLCAIDEHIDVPGDEDVEKQAEDADSSYRIHLILHAMEEPYKEVFQLRVFGNLSFRMIGEIFGKTESWARVTYHRARLKIRERMDVK